MRSGPAALTIGAGNPAIGRPTVFARIPLSRRAYFIDGPARGRTVLSAGSPANLTWEGADGSVHRYRRVTHVESANLYQHVR